jgi:hypothetical protein
VNDLLVSSIADAGTHFSISEAGRTLLLIKQDGSVHLDESLTVDEAVEAAVEAISFRPGPGFFESATRPGVTFAATVQFAQPEWNISLMIDGTVRSAGVALSERQQEFFDKLARRYAAMLH